MALLPVVVVRWVDAARLTTNGCGLFYGGMRGIDPPYIPSLFHADPPVVLHALAFMFQKLVAVLAVHSLDAPLQAADEIVHSAQGDGPLQVCEAGREPR